MLSRLSLIEEDYAEGEGEPEIEDSDEDAAYSLVKNNNNNTKKEHKNCLVLSYHLESFTK